MTYSASDKRFFETARFQPRPFEPTQMLVLWFVIPHEVRICSSQVDASYISMRSRIAPRWTNPIS